MGSEGKWAGKSGKGSNKVRNDMHHLVWNWFVSASSGLMSENSDYPLHTQSLFEIPKATLPIHTTTIELLLSWGHLKKNESGKIWKSGGRVRVINLCLREEKTANHLMWMITSSTKPNPWQSY